MDEIISDFDELLLDKESSQEILGVKAEKRLFEVSTTEANLIDDVEKRNVSVACEVAPLGNPLQFGAGGAKELDSEASGLGGLTRTSPDRSPRTKRGKLHRKGKKKKGGLLRSSSTEGEGSEQKTELYSLRRSKVSSVK